MNPVVALAGSIPKRNEYTVNDRSPMDHNSDATNSGRDSDDGGDDSGSTGSITDGTGPDPDLAQGESE